MRKTLTINEIVKTAPGQCLCACVWSWGILISAYLLLIWRGRIHGRSAARERERKKVLINLVSCVIYIFCKSSHRDRTARWHLRREINSDEQYNSEPERESLNDDFVHVCTDENSVVYTFSTISSTTHMIWGLCRTTHTQLQLLVLEVWSHHYQHYTSDEWLEQRSGNSNEPMRAMQIKVFYLKQCLGVQI